MQITRRRMLGTGTAAIAVLAGAATGLPPMSALAQPAAAPEPPPSQALAAFFKAYDDAFVAKRPQLETSLGTRYDRGELNDASDAFAEAAQVELQETAGKLKASFDPATLNAQDRLSYDLFLYRAEQAEALFPWRFHDYALTHLGGAHTGLPAFMINQHRIRTAPEATAYVQRLGQIARVLGQTGEAMTVRAGKGVIPPKFSLAKAQQDALSLLSGAPFDDSGRDSPLLADLTRKLDEAKIPAAQRSALLEEATRTLRDGVAPAYRRLAETIAAMEKVATTDDGAWKLPDGGAYYDAQVRRHTTLPMTAEEVHEYGLSEVARLLGEMDGIKAKVGFAGDRQAFLHFLRTDAQFFFPDTDAGREGYLVAARKAIADITEKLPQLFHTLPKAPVEVRRVEPFRERTSAPAFYNRPSEDGSRPGIYFINLATMRERPKYEIEAIAYHEANPGHHMQNSIQQEATNLPLFRRTGGYTAFGEGWGLYAELLGKEVGLYQDPYSDAGRINTELWRANRLVVDSGIHAKKWTRDQAIDYMASNSIVPKESVVREVERYIVNPGQALAYKIGMKAIQDLRAKAQGALGERFDRRSFHELILVRGSRPLPMLQADVEAWIARGGVG